MLLVDKPPGPTSHDVVAITRRALHTRRVGHAGTLDPFATGLLIVLVGVGTRLVRYLVGLPKLYEGTIRLGATTATDDVTGAVLEASDAWTSLGEPAIRAAMTALTGEREQVPPSYSAKRTGGERAHRLVRRGVPVTLAPQHVSVRRFVLEVLEGRDLRFQADVSSGTYVRSLARELGERLGCGAHLLALRRLAVGDFTVSEAVPLERVRDGAAELLPLLRAVRHLAQAEIDAAQYERLAHGQAIEATLAGERAVALMCAGRLVAVAQPRDGRWHPEVVLAP